MKRRTRELSDVDKIVSSHFFLRPRTVIHFLLVIIQIIVLLLGACYNHWPRYCMRNNWAYFSVVGLHVSAMINILSTFITYVIFEDLNWVLISTLLFIHGGMFTLCGILYISDELSGCSKCQLPVLRISAEVVDEDSMKSRMESPKDAKHLRDSMETTVAYSTFVLGVSYLIILSYYLLRREKV